MMFVLVAEERPTPAERPNIVILLADDFRPDAIAALGNPAVRTPHLDQLARRGLIFRRAYNFGSNQAAVCLPSRNMFLSGRSYFRWKGRPHASAEQPNLPRSFNDAGYATFHIGKGGNIAAKIEPLFQTHSYLKDRAERTSGEPGRAAIDRSLEWLAQQPSDRPYLMYIAFEAPHDPRVAADKYRVGYDASSYPLPGNFLPEHPFDNGELRVRDEQLAPWPRTPEEIRRQLVDYAAVITGLDHHIGRLMAAIQSRGDQKNTVILFASDNGLAIGSHGLMGKQNLYEHSARVPLIIAGPGIPAGESPSLTYLFDIYPTLCDLAHIPIPEGLDGISLLPILGDPKKSLRQELLLTYRHQQRAITTDRWKLILYPPSHRTQLFDLMADPLEQIDLSPSKDHQETRDQLFQRLRLLQQQFADELPLDPPS
jgi:arylsulfatase A-like enzyme